MTFVRNTLKIVVCVCLTGCHALPIDASRQVSSRPEAGAIADRPTSGSVDPRCLVPAQVPEKQPADLEGGQVIYLQLSAGDLRELAGKASPTPAPPTPSPVATPIVLQVPTPQPAPPPATPVVVPSPSEHERIPALQRELAHHLSLRINDLRAKVQELNTQVKARSAPPKALALDTVKTSVQELKQGIAKIDERLQALDARRQPSPSSAEPAGTNTTKTSVAATSSAAPQPVPQLATTIPAEMPSDTLAVGAVLVRTGEQLSGSAPPESQREINRLITQCLSELEKEVRDLHARIGSIAPPPK